MREYETLATRDRKDVHTDEVISTTNTNTTTNDTNSNNYGSNNNDAGDDTNNNYNNNTNNINNSSNNKPIIVRSLGASSVIFEKHLRVIPERHNSPALIKSALIPCSSIRRRVLDL